MNEKKHRTVVGRIEGDLLMGMPAYIVTDQGTLKTSPVESIHLGTIGATITTKNTVYTVRYKCG